MIENQTATIVRPWKFPTVPGKIIIDASNKNYSVHIGNVSDSTVAVGDKAKASGGGDKSSAD